MTQKKKKIPYDKRTYKELKETAKNKCIGTNKIGKDGFKYPLTKDELIAKLRKRNKKAKKPKKKREAKAKSY